MKILKIKDWISYQKGLAFQKMIQDKQQAFLNEPDIVYFQKTLFKALKVPKQFITYQENDKK